MRILFFGDIVGRIGRQAIKKIVPELKKEFQPDLVMANAENSAHGIGVTKKILDELHQSGIDFFTSGNHVFKKVEANQLLDAADSILLRPANYQGQKSGNGYKVIEAGSRKILVINLMGQVFVKEEFDSPFIEVDKILNQVDQTGLAGVIIDFHAEATSEKEAFGWYVDGRASAVLGTHTHVPTADAKILPGGTAYITDVGMVGADDSIIGNVKGPVLESFLSDVSHRVEIPEEGEVRVNAVLLEVDPKTRKAIKIERLDRKIKV